jgi:hypothetical protein
MTIAGLLLGLINIAIVIAILILIGAIAMWLASIVGFPIPGMVQRIFMVIVALVALYMIVALLLGFPVVHVIGHM